MSSLIEWAESLGHELVQAEAKALYPYQKVWTSPVTGSNVGGVWVDEPGASVTCWCDVWNPQERSDSRSRAAVQQPDFAKGTWLGEVREGEPVPPVKSTCEHNGAVLEVTHIGEENTVSKGTPLVLRWRQ
ncbi:hypothetical protein [Deinococcus cellulosilyticus]|uniref:Uncharacterized protein n=1 Tax=Deinococcus cellulosilyticus (strain DSM 18568 / NBRC 106333 / KACC 11606 / 5516J-15) TaxID=1223518 RepID=A0A511MZD2_DEIC1|nr:hypothetical protein [Deinococcus cellulosilyticus]GEM45909.1 hypothetical protein DC3_15440 [Deinococcus cellulosilyticus NBRC 106333 = KACC 11606]